MSTLDPDFIGLTIKGLPICDLILEYVSSSNINFGVGRLCVFQIFFDDIFLV